MALLLPSNSKQEWIPSEWVKQYDQMNEHSAWYSGDADQLIATYSSSKTLSSVNGRFWGENAAARDRRSVVHVPIAGDIATFSADMLFSERPEILIPEAYKRDANKQLIANKRATAADERLTDIIEKGDVITRLLEAAETSAAMGGVYLKPTWDRELSSVPILSIAQPDSAIPYFKYGFLAGVIFHRVITSDNNKVYRLLENYRSDGWIESGLYVGDNNVIGNRVPLGYLEETAAIEPFLNTRLEKLACRYVPNKRPHKRFRGTAVGMSDYQGSETLMDALDLTMTSWIRDIRLGRARLHVGDGMLQRQDNVTYFDGGKELYVELDVDPSMLGENGGINATQFNIRVQEHNDTATKLIQQILNNAGYAPQTFGLNLDGSISTESHQIRERKTYITKQKKERFFKEALADVFQMMLMIDNYHLGNPTPFEFRPNITFADTLGHDIGSMANTIQTLSNARSASVQTRVEMLHPDWSVEEVADEVARIREEEGMNVTDPLTIGGKEYV